ncbi:MAG: hypothetical protein A2365_01960 [Candidatus Nealsonbacteria bacterium RIFOXYB1_FULL_40_15]|uniref:Elongation factor P C-terminal domain-containing protein n=2 Tax=Candidatus Nealsoniibacteriota TaxID=1817911 RepID=A0A1G2EUT6_9BACT|nr:MAG: hypothetical protein A2365_01960 [Candidatus Nealsonbacteria bacterium RIFOXYB1_FULL_40_15]OGZ29096.1 MAG: hypothetical protein A2562_01525 [Candidatus Nealsonbacteria bacterium RIFOXYD1_FULL_39_11]OGZ29120.1 MAG: hypothetical protein A2427_02410 [Candidatus Nealsonbacteria bacterium RIFOXYC1_FULL_40_7]
MISHSELRKGIRIIIDGQPYEVLWSMPMKKAQRRVVIQTKIKNLVTGNVFERNFHQGDIFEEAELERTVIKFIYSNKDKYVFCYPDKPSERFELSKEQIGSAFKFLKSNIEVDGLVYEDRIISISTPIKMELAVKEAPPGIKGDRAQGGTKTVKLETGAEIQVPLFIEEGDTIEINTEKEEYVRRIEKK